jgi:hypothetical protein
VSKKRDLGHSAQAEKARARATTLHLPRVDAASPRANVEPCEMR